MSASPPASFFPALAVRTGEKKKENSGKRLKKKTETRVDHTHIQSVDGASDFVRPCKAYDVEAQRDMSQIAVQVSRVKVPSGTAPAIPPGSAPTCRRNSEKQKHAPSVRSTRGSAPSPKGSAIMARASSTPLPVGTLGSDQRKEGSQQKHGNSFFFSRPFFLVWPRTGTFVPSPCPLSHIHRP